MRNFFRVFPVIAVFLSLVTVPSNLRAETVMSLTDCIAAAIENQPAIRAARENVLASLGRETQATSTYFPQLTASTGYSESHSLGGFFGSSITKGTTTTLSVDQVLYDFGKTGHSVDAARWSTRSVQQDAERVTQETVLSVRQAYYALLQARKLVAVAQETLDQTESHLKQAQAFFRAGSKPRFDVTRAEVDVNSARLGLINARNSVRIRTIALNNAMGVDPARATEIEEALPPTPVIPKLEQAQNEALGSRPEILKAESDVEAAKARVRAERSHYLPTLSANGAYNWTNGTSETEFQGNTFTNDVQNSWNYGVTLALPLFQGGLTRGRVSEARANLIALEAQRDAMKQSILLEVNQAYADLESATARVEVMESTVKKARENLDLARGRYDAGIGPSIEVTDAQLSAVNAETDHLQALYDYHLAIAHLFKAMGKGREQ